VFENEVGSVSGSRVNRRQRLDFPCPGVVNLISCRSTLVRSAYKIPLRSRNTQFSGPYVFGFYGQDSGGVRFAVAGTFTPDGLGAITAGAFDSDAGGTLSSNMPITSGNYSIGPNGRGTVDVGHHHQRSESSRRVYDQQLGSIFVTTDSIAVAPIFSGETQRSATVAFTNLSLSGTAVFHLSGDSSNAGMTRCLQWPPRTARESDLIHIFQNIEGVFTTQTVTTGTYSVASNGRVT